jgi:hypothetical protein
VPPVVQGAAVGWVGGDAVDRIGGGRVDGFGVVVVAAAVHDQDRGPVEGAEAAGGVGVAEVVVDGGDPGRAQARMGESRLPRGRRMLADAADGEQVDVDDLEPNCGDSRWRGVCIRRSPS